MLFSKCRILQVIHFFPLLFPLPKGLKKCLKNLCSKYYEIKTPPTPILFDQSGFLLLALHCLHCFPCTRTLVTCCASVDHTVGNYQASRFRDAKATTGLGAWDKSGHSSQYESLTCLLQHSTMVNILVACLQVSCILIQSLYGITWNSFQCYEAHFLFSLSHSQKLEGKYRIFCSEASYDIKYRTVLLDY